MLAALPDPGAFAWPLAITAGTAAVADRVRTAVAARRRRELLNRALHELRRPLQALALCATPRQRREQLELAIVALADLDRAVNGGERHSREELADAEALVRRAAGRWRDLAAVGGRRIELRWQANGTRVRCDPDAIARALDNLISNSLEHGRGPVRLEGAVRGGSLRLMVTDGVDAGGSARAVDGRPGRPIAAARARRRDPRRGHGLRLVAQIAADHGGRFAACRHDTGASAVLELPLPGAALGKRIA